MTQLVAVGVILARTIEDVPVGGVRGLHVFPVSLDLVDVGLDRLSFVGRAVDRVRIEYADPDYLAGLAETNGATPDALLSDTAGQIGQAALAQL